MAIKTFSDAKDYLESLVLLDAAVKHATADERRLRFEKMTALANEVGDPQDSYPVVHIGGTAGKGSTATMLAAIMQGAGYKIGLNVSPNLEDVRERMQVNMQLMPEADFVDLVKWLSKSAKKFEKKHGELTYLEAIDIISFEYFKREKVDIAIVEAHFGGVFDGTNIVKSKVAVLTNVGLDHTEVLGDTVEEIAADKVGIFKKGAEVVSGVTQQSVIGIVEHKAKEMRCRLDLLGRNIKYTILNADRTGTAFDLELSNVSYKGIALSAVGEHQVANAALAIDAATKLGSYGFEIREDDIRSALSSINIPGRFEYMGDTPTVIIDGAHNPMKTAALAQTLGQLYKDKKIRFVFAVKRGKMVNEMLDTLSPLASKFYFCRFESSTDFGKLMSLDPKKLRKLTKIESEAVDDALTAYKKALSEAKDDEIICITGSLYLVGELRTALKSNAKY